MLGLSSGLIYSSRAETTLIDYTSDFSSGVDGWVEYAVTEGSMTISANQNPNSDGGPDESGWLKINWDTNQTSTSGFQKTFHTNSLINGDDLTIGYKIFIPNSSNQFIGSDLITYKVASVTGTTAMLSLVTDSGDQVVDFNTALISPATISNYDEGETVKIQFRFDLSTDYPQAGADVYIKNVNILHTRLS